MAEYVQNGKYMEYTATTDIAYMEVVALGDRIGVARTPIKAGETGTVAVEEVYSLPAKAGVAIEQGASVYWNKTDKLIDAKTDASIPAGWAFAAKASAETEVLVKIG